ncbi:RNA-directed DNA polymerase from mobile element jockey [Holothuria leucospilota]|uniref:RNA-directed DNA polymerase from mobile element jockey n=1 Tax=Holothuria leucospilota TaxID=206669 RepID=A0A9Q1BCK2_HOLLE|nr:RNA-directed DNA polymerase from mobile element jockey [Holothuria leucospilota]
MIIPERSLRIFPNSKPWVSKKLKSLVYEKKAAFSSGDQDLVKEKQREIKKEVKRCKKEHGKKLEDKFEEGNTKAAWQVMQSVTGHKGKNKCGTIRNGQRLVNGLNEFYCRFDVKSDELVNTVTGNKLRTTTTCANTTDRVIVNESDVRKLFANVKIGKATSPDGVTNMLIKTCSSQLAPVFTPIFQRTLDEGIIPEIWKTSIITPVPKTKVVSVLNDYRPISLTSNVIKCLERVVLKLLLAEKGVSMDKNQFAYQSKRGVDDAILVYLHEVLKHLDQPEISVRSLFIDFSSAFNTIKPSMLVQKLFNMQVNYNIVLWVPYYLCCKPQVVKMGNFESDQCVISTGAPQGCVLSPVLFCLYTNDCQKLIDKCNIIKYADDTVLTGFIYGNDGSAYISEVQNFVGWCKKNSLVLNVDKTKELVFDFSKGNNTHDHVIINGKAVERVENYKYLGTYIDNKLNWNLHTKFVKGKACQRLYFLRKLKQCKVDVTIMKLFYQSVIQSVLTFSIICFFGSLPKNHRVELERIRKSPERCIGSSLPSLSLIYEECLIKKLDSKRKDETHPFHSLVSFNRSGNRLQVPLTKTSRFRNSFLPEVLHLFNSNVKRSVHSVNL